MPTDTSKNAAKRAATGEASSAAPRVITELKRIREAVLAAREAGKTVGLVPTMGALHEGHLSLVDRARTECDVAVATIFVNPTQFAPNEDFKRYPRDLDHDLALLGGRGCELVFAPNVADMYAADHATSVDVGHLGAVLDGEFRPTHFSGVATIVLKLFQLAPADRAFFGRKDYQQTLVVRQMVRDLNVPIDVRVCPIVREPDGLAMSSRNQYLCADDRRRAASLSRSLQLAEQMTADGERDVERLRKAMQRLLDTEGIDVQYIAFVADGSVTPVDQIEGPTTVAIAAKVGHTRLIDNTLLVSGSAVAE